jgi:hypothetical protein
MSMPDKTEPLYHSFYCEKNTGQEANLKDVQVGKTLHGVKTMHSSASMQGLVILKIGHEN